ncbi:hypothetical protein G7046_g320 [Stylonectria norvegica]|nr:hypothetical protein G7046_g320 [Stylonectria norvegica]
MGQKRDFEELGSPDSDQGSPEPQLVDDGDSSSKRRKYSTRNKHRANEGTSEWAKKRARTIERSLHRDHDLPANVRNDLERELAAHKATVTDKAFQRRRSAMITKYHMVRFFGMCFDPRWKAGYAIANMSYDHAERKKAMRLAKQLRRQVEQNTSPDEAETLAQNLHIAEVDEAYTLYHPHAEPYISLYTSAKAQPATDDEEKTPKAKALLKAERPPMWSTVEKTMEEGVQALQRLRERRSPDNAPIKGRAPQKRRKTNTSDPTAGAAGAGPKKEQRQHPTNGPEVANGKKSDSQTRLNRRERRKLERETKTADESDDGGFFEET